MSPNSQFGFLWQFSDNQFSSFSMLRLLSISLLSIFLLVDGIAAASNCFTQRGDRYTKHSKRIDIVSAGLVCPQSQSNSTCSVESGGYLTEWSTLNITTPNSNADVFRAVRQTLNQPFDRFIVGTVDSIKYTIQSGKNGYIGFTLSYYCYQGVLGGGCFKDVNAGTAVEACEPRTSATGGEIPALDGQFSFVSTDAQSAKFTTNPAAAKPTVFKDSLAYRAERSGGLLAFAAIVLMVALLGM